jgi:hypothetical protein
MVLAAISFLGTVAYAVLTMPVWLAAIVLISHLVLAIISAILVRVGLETFLVIFRMVEHLENLKHLKTIAESKSRATAS